MSLEFTWQWYTMEDGTVTDDPQPCDFCEADVPVYSFRNSAAGFKNGPNNERMFLCDLCGATPAGNAYQYPLQFPNYETMQVINYGNNMILKQLGAFGTRPEKPHE